ncbi:hypothetical protein AK812_SmicGene34826 [Symbiodinium microadriaticum]|uniref:Uncharacterized protein n=1 Tax=Symbiodinium microadriaticum TaxID=2951 RepID=A0A1Q9CN33_SYMMI|nr:hypothetical protein AK812_SmicGene34826 [Symbiodinium microadriaticum]
MWRTQSANLPNLEDTRRRGKAGRTAGEGAGGGRKGQEAEAKGKGKGKAKRAAQASQQPGTRQEAVAERQGMRLSSEKGLPKWWSEPRSAVALDKKKKPGIAMAAVLQPLRRLGSQFASHRGSQMLVKVSSIEWTDPGLGFEVQGSVNFWSLRASLCGF